MFVYRWFSVLKCRLLLITHNIFQLFTFYLLFSSILRFAIIHKLRLVLQSIILWIYFFYYTWLLLSHFRALFYLCPAINHAQPRYCLKYVEPVCSPSWINLDAKAIALPWGSNNRWRLLSLLQLAKGRQDKTYIRSGVCISRGSTFTLLTNSNRQNGQLASGAGSYELLLLNYLMIIF